MWPSLDYRTLFLASAFVCSVLLMLMAMQVRRPYPGFVRVIAALAAVSAAIIIADFRGYAPDALLSVQLTAIGSLAFIDSGVRLFCDTPRRGWRPYLYVPAGMLLLTYFYFTRPLHQRIILMSLLSIPIFIDTAIPMLRRAPKGRLFGHRFAGMVSVLGCVAAGFRIVAVWSSRAYDSPYFSANPANTTFFLLVFLLLLGMGFGFITLSHERLVAELQAAHRSIEEVKRLAAVGRLASGVAHFFNDQLCAIQLANSLLRESLRTRDGPFSSLVDEIDNVDEIDEAVRHGANINRRLQQYARANTLQPSRFNPMLLVEEILPGLRRIAGKKVEVIISSSSSMPPVNLDADLLKETIFALVQNARDAMPSGGKLKISLREQELEAASASEFDIPPGQFVLLSIVDTGSGMDDEVRSHIFEPFFTTKGLANAEGLGLACAYGFLRQSGGTIRVSSAPHYGSTFELYLPKAPSVQRELAAA